MTAVATLIGDVVGSRSAADRHALHARLEEVLADVNARTEPLQPLRLTVGDEFQGPGAAAARLLTLHSCCGSGCCPRSRPATASAAAR